MHSYSFPPPNWHPHCTNTVQVISYSGIYNQLVEYNPETEDPADIRGDLATSWELSKDGKAYTFHLNPKAKWHDGKPVTAEDVVYSLDSMVDADAKPPRVVTLPAVSPYYAKGTARAIDAHTVEVPLKIPNAADFLPTLALDFCKIIAKHWGEADIDHQKWENAMGSGPFKPGKFVKDVSIELEKNKDYWKHGLPYIDGMVHYTIKDKGTAIAAYKTGRVLTSNWAVSNLSSKEAGATREGSGRPDPHRIHQELRLVFLLHEYERGAVRQPEGAAGRQPGDRSPGPARNVRGAREGHPRPAAGRRDVVQPLGGGDRQSARLAAA